jgi:outer membrane protein, heavy metal efflux system
MNRLLLRAANRRWLPRCRWCAVLLLCCQSVLAADDSGLSLREAIANTLAANPELKLYPLRNEVVASERDTTSLVPPLVLTGTLEDALGTGDLSGIKRSQFTLSLSQVVELGDQHERHITVASQRMDLLAAEQRITELDVLAEVTRRFIGVAAAQQRFLLSQRATQLANTTLDGVRTLVNAAQSPLVEQTRATAALARARLAEQQAQATLTESRIRLVSLWASQQADFISVDAELLNTGAAGELTPLLLAVDANPDIQLFASEARLHDAELQVALSERRGEVQWTAGVRHLREVNDVGLVLGFSHALGSDKRQAGAIRSSNAKLQEVAGRRDVALNQLRAQLYALHTQLQQAIAEANTLQNSVLPLLNTALEQTRAAYLGGRYSYLDLTSAQNETLAAELALINAAEDVHLLRAGIERLSGAALNP